MSAAAEQGHADAHFFLGVMHMKGLGVRRKSAQRAFSYFMLAAHTGHTLAMYNAAVIQLQGRGTTRACKPAVALLKQLAEKGPVAGAVQQGHEHFFRGSYSQALLAYLRVGEMGMELGQSNAVWMLDRGYGPSEQHASTATTIFKLYKLSAEQGNVNSLLRLGDVHYHGKGVARDLTRAAAIYYDAYISRTPEAMFNLGFVHEFGTGVPKDLNLARRFYAMAAAASKDAAVPANIAIGWLNVHEAFEAVQQYLPEWLGRQLDVFTWQEPHSSMLGSAAGRMQWLIPTQLLLHCEVMLWRWLDLAGLSKLQAVWSGGKDLGETVTLIVLAASLWFVLKLRRQRALAEGGGAAAQQQQRMARQRAAQQRRAARRLRPREAAPGQGPDAMPHGAEQQQPPAQDGPPAAD